MKSNSNLKIYISRSNFINDMLLRELDTQLHSLPYFENLKLQTIWHNKSYNYIPVLLEESDVVIVLLDSFVSVMGKGVYEEIKKAESLNKIILFAYLRKVDNSFQFYSYKFIKNKDESDYRNFGTLKLIENIYHRSIDKILNLFKDKNVSESIDDAVDIDLKKLLLLLC